MAKAPIRVLAALRATCGIIDLCVGARVLAFIGALLCVAIAPPARAADQLVDSSVEQLRNLSIEDLANVKITSVSKNVQSLSDAAASVYVISHDDIVRSGAVTLPEMLRLAPNLQVAQLNAFTYAISARGMNAGNNASMSNKLLVLIDGRTVYTPLFAGVYWDMQGVLPENIARIEVISGPAGTLYGANAVNGVINVITRNSADTQGGVLDAMGGNRMWGGSAQYGGRYNDNLTYRGYVMGNRFGPNLQANGTDGTDAWSTPQGGGRVDWSRPGDLVTIEGDVFQASEEPGASVAGRNLIANWQHQLGGQSSFQVQAYYDLAKRNTDGGGGFRVDTYDLSLQHNFALGSWNDITWGAGERAISYQIENTSSLLFVPAGRTFTLANVFAQDSLSLTDRLKLVLGLKLENEPYTGLEPLPSARVAWKVTDEALLWTAVSRAVRAPTPVDRDLIERIGTTNILDQSFNFQPETLTAYEAGTRIQITPRASVSLTGFYSLYDNLRSVETTPGTILPLRWGNMMEGRIYGLETWGNYAVTDRWRLGVGFNIQHEHFRPKPGSTDVGGVSFVANDPNHQASLRSSLDLLDNVTWDVFLRYVGTLHSPGVPEYVEVNTRLGWRVTPAVEISLSGFNLVHSHHPEFNEAGTSNQVPRSFLVETRVRF